MTRLLSAACLCPPQTEDPGDDHSPEDVLGEVAVSAVDLKRDESTDRDECQKSGGFFEEAHASTLALFGRAYERHLWAVRSLAGSAQAI